MTDTLPTPDAAHPGVHAAVEAEVTFEIGPDDPTPDLAPLFRLGRTQELRLRAVYHDTPDLVLLRNRVTLRRREGGHDAGWHVKLPAGAARMERHVDLTEGDGRWRVPREHVDAVAAHLGPVWEDRPAAERGLVPVAVISTRRVESELLDDTGAVVASLCDDHVEALPAGRRWRELEVELVPGADPALLDAAVAHLAAQGVPVGASPSKLGRALADDVARIERGKGPRRKGPAGRVVMAHVARQLAVLRGREDGLRADAPEAVHKARVATRRLRSALRTFRDLFDRDVTDPLRDELRWYAGVLGAPRDAEVIRARILAEVDSVPAADVVGEVREGVAAELERRHATAHAALVEALDGPRYARLMDMLTEFVADPPLQALAAGSAAEVLPPLVDRSVRRVRRAARAVRGPDRIPLLHEARKRSKAMRYACEALAPSFGADWSGRAAVWEQATESLGQVQDIEVALHTLRSLREEAGARGESAYTLGWLAGRQAAALEPAVEAGEDALGEALAASPVGRGGAGGRRGSGGVAGE